MTKIPNCKNTIDKKLFLVLSSPEKVVLPDDVQCYHDQLYQSLICEWTGRNSTCWDFSM